MSDFASRRVRGRYVNLHSDVDHGPRDVWRWFRERQVAPWPVWVEDPPQPPPPRLMAGQIGATFIGHASWLVQIGGVAVLIDPVWSPRASPLPFAGPKRVRAPGQRLEALPGADLLLVSHNHYDHCDLATLRQVQARWAPPALTSLGTGRLLAKAGLRAPREMDWWDRVAVAGLRVTYVPAQHFSARTPFDRNRALWGGFVIQAPDGATVYFMGDTGWCPHPAEIGRRFGRIDLALIPVGAYAPRWFMQTQHMDPDEAVQAHIACGARASLAMHFGTFFRLTDEPIDEPAELLEAAKARHGVAQQAFRVPGFGQTLIYPAA
ncbi:MBL fold metallo-hydrolase [Falsiroseomonas sp.]|uniref:MBL fold metallo-hydrolase n=1 Tax=Falsiroseomonas sp. TaxID=2870721 RepID=UPI002737752F|nr:MBL fold metallo-hydrolase [Falsiroseomonas sp.]MDP3415579.1 MBL fold metallo-hydrolase [Falsiroseomonas sp.]